MESGTSQPTKTYHVFISHSSKDAEWCRRLVKALSDVEFRVEYDEQYIKIGQNWLKRIEERIRSADVFMVILSPDANESHWVQEETYLALENRKFIVGIMHRNTEVRGFLNTHQIFNIVGLSGEEAARKIVNALQDEDVANDIRFGPLRPPNSIQVCKITYGQFVGEDNCFFAVDDGGSTVLHSSKTFRGEPGKNYGDYQSDKQAYDQLRKRLLRRGWKPMPGSPTDLWYQGRFERTRSSASKD